MSRDQRKDVLDRSWRALGTQDFLGGLALIAIALVALWSSRDLPGMHGVAFGPGTAPRLVSVFLLVCGIGVAASGIWRAGPASPRYFVRGPFFILLAVAVFACSIQALGLMLSSYFTFIIAALGYRETRWLESVLVGAAIALCCSLLFSFGLNLPFELWPTFLR